MTERTCGHSALGLSRRQHDHTFAARQHLVGLLQHSRRDDHVGDDLHDELRGRAVERPVDRDHPAKRGDLVALISHPISGGDVLRHRQAARVGVLDDGRRRSLEIADQREGRGRVLDVVEAELFALELFGTAQTARVGPETVERRALVLVLAVLERLRELARK